MSRFARNQRVYYFEEPVYEGVAPRLKRSICRESQVHIITPALPDGTHGIETHFMLRALLRELMQSEHIREHIAWFYTPMALEFTDELNPALTVYDCMDELSAFAHAPAGMVRNESKLFEQCDLVFTGGASLFEAKCSKHNSVYLLPSSVDTAQFAKALPAQPDPEDQKRIAHPRIGYVGVIDERMDLQLIDALAHRRPEWQILLIGPVVKIDPNTLPRHSNVHYLGMKAYNELPSYLSGWDVALLPFAQNDSTRFISPTKTPEYLAAGLPVVSTPIRDVVRPYGESGLVFIGKNHDEFVAGVEQQLVCGRQRAWSPEVTAFLRTQSWDKTFESMSRLMKAAMTRKRRRVEQGEESANAFLTPSMSAAHV